MREDDAFRLKDRQNLAGTGWQIIVALVWKDQDISMLRVGFRRIKCQTPQEQDFTSLCLDIICHNLPCFLEGPVCPEQKRQISRIPDHAPGRECVEDVSPSERNVPCTERCNPDLTNRVRSVRLNFHHAVLIRLKPFQRLDALPCAENRKVTVIDLVRGKGKVIKMTVCDKHRIILQQFIICQRDMSALQLHEWVEQDLLFPALQHKNGSSKPSQFHFSHSISAQSAAASSIFV